MRTRLWLVPTVLDDGVLDEMGPLLMTLMLLLVFGLASYFGLVVAPHLTHSDRSAAPCLA